MVDCWIWLLCSTLAGSMFVFGMEVSTRAEFRHLIVEICFEHQMLRHFISKLKCLCFKKFFCHSLPKHFPQHSLRQLEHTLWMYLLSRGQFPMLLMETQTSGDHHQKHVRHSPNDQTLHQRVKVVVPTWFSFGAPTEGPKNPLSLGGYACNPRTTLGRGPKLCLVWSPVWGNLPWSLLTSPSTVNNTAGCRQLPEYVLTVSGSKVPKLTVSLFPCWISKQTMSWVVKHRVARWMTKKNHWRSYVMRWNGYL